MNTMPERQLVFWGKSFVEPFSNLLEIAEVLLCKTAKLQVRGLSDLPVVFGMATKLDSKPSSGICPVSYITLKNYVICLTSTCFNTYAQA